MTPRIMIVDDEPDVRTIVAATLKPHYEVVEAFDGLDALEKLDRYEPDLVVIDVMMPLINGFEACAAIRRHPKFRDIPVMFLTALGEKEAMLKGYKSGANLYLTKPFDPDRLLRNVQAFFEKSPPPTYEKRYTIEQIAALESEKPAGLHAIADIHEADTLFDFTIPKEVIEWRKKHKNARRPQELSESLEPTQDELKNLKERWKREVQSKKTSSYSFKPAPSTPEAPKEAQQPPPRQETSRPQPAGGGWDFPRPQTPAPRPPAFEEQKPGISLEGIPRIVPARRPSQAAKSAFQREAGLPMDEPSIEMPAGPQPPAPVPEAPSPHAAGDKGLRPRIMVIDDDLDIIELCRLTLGDEFEVVWATDGLSGIEHLVSWEPDLLLLDIMIPKVSGYQILQSLRRNRTFRNLIVVMISAKGSQRDKDYAYRLGANSYVVKPFAPSSLHELITKYTSRRSFTVRPKTLPIEVIRPQLPALPEEFQDAFAEDAEARVSGAAPAPPRDETDFEKMTRELRTQEEAVIRQMEMEIHDKAEPDQKKHKRGFPFFRKG
ncbi:MAG: hypothetical protein Kow0059_00450 [Candidatus Sumerlaeia bacterium]